MLEISVKVYKLVSKASLGSSEKHKTQPNCKSKDLLTFAKLKGLLQPTRFTEPTTLPEPPRTMMYKLFLSPINN